jgi:hypothetical protein
MTTDRFEAFCGGVSPAGLVIVMAPDGPVGGAKVLGVTREGATTWPLAKLAGRLRATAKTVVVRISHNNCLESRRVRAI